MENIKQKIEDAVTGGVGHSRMNKSGRKIEMLVLPYLFLDENELKARKEAHKDFIRLYDTQEDRMLNALTDNIERERISKSARLEIELITQALRVKEENFIFEKQRGYLQPNPSPEESGQNIEYNKDFEERREAKLIKNNCSKVHLADLLVKKTILKWGGCCKLSMGKPQTYGSSKSSFRVDCIDNNHPQAQYLVIPILADGKEVAREIYVKRNPTDAFCFEKIQDKIPFFYPTKYSFEKFAYSN